MTAKKSCAIKAAAAFFLTGSMLFASTSCSDDGAGTHQTATIAEPDGKDYSFTYPDGWEVIRSDSMYAIQSPDKVANISSSCYTMSLEGFDLASYEADEDSDPYASLLDDYVNREEIGYIALLKDNFGENVEIISIEDCTLGERAGKKLVYHMKVGEDDYHFATVLAILPTVGDAYLYDLTYTALGETAFSEHLPVFDGAVASFEFK